VPAPQNITTASQLFLAVKEENLYSNRILQTAKDFQLASVVLEEELNISTTPEKLVTLIEDAVYAVIQKDTVSYLNLLYIIDVPEKAINQLEPENTEQFAKDVAFLILKRCWLKVWYKAKY